MSHDRHSFVQSLISVGVADLQFVAILFLTANLYWLSSVKPHLIPALPEYSIML